MFITFVGIAGTAVVGIFGWVFQRGFILSNRVTVVETHQKDLPNLIEVQFASVNQRLDRIERSMNGFLHKD